MNHTVKSFSFPACMHGAGQPQFCLKRDMEKVAQEEPREETADEAETEKRVVWLQALLARFGHSNGSGSAAAWQIAGTSFTAPRHSTLAGIVVVVIINSMVVSSLLPAASAEQQPSDTSSLSEQPSVRSPLWSPPSPWPPPPPVPPCIILAPPQAPPPSTPSPSPSPSPTPPSTPPSPPPRMLTHDEQCAVLNDRFEHAHPSNSLLEAGVLVRQFDTLDDATKPWRACPATGHNNWCYKFSDRWAASIITPRARMMYYGIEGIGGLVLAPTLELFCACALAQETAERIGTQRRRSMRRQRRVGRLYACTFIGAEPPFELVPFVASLFSKQPLLFASPLPLLPIKPPGASPGAHAPCIIAFAGLRAPGVCMQIPRTAIRWTRSATRLAVTVPHASRGATLPGSNAPTSDTSGRAAFRQRTCARRFKRKSFGFLRGTTRWWWTCAQSSEIFRTRSLDSFTVRAQVPRRSSVSKRHGPISSRTMG